MAQRTNEEWIEAFAAYLKRRFPDRSTAIHYVSDMRIFVEYHGKPLTHITVQDVDTFVDHERARGLAPATVKRRVATLKSFNNFVAEELGEPLRVNPVSMQRHGGRLGQRLPRDLTDAEVEQVLAVVENPRDRAMISLMLYGGLRVGEVASLRGMDIRVPEDEAAPIRLLVCGKGRKERVAYLSRAGYEPLAAYLAMEGVSEPKAAVFRNRFGKPISVSGIQDRMRRYAEASGVAVTCHRLRHTYGRWMAEGEVPVLSLSRLMGHAQLESTQRYIDGADPQVRTDYEKAMARAVEPVAAETEPAPEPTGTPSDNGPATVTRPDPPAFDGADWMPDWPDWLRAGCLAWIQHKWWQWKPSRRKQHARRALDQLRTFWTWQLDHGTLQGFEGLQASDVAAFVDAQLARDLAPKTVDSLLDALYALLRYQLAQAHLTELPARPKIALPDPLPRHLSPREVLDLEAHVRQLQDTADDATWLVLALYYLLAHAGLRICEALDLQVVDLDLPARRLRVREGKGRRDRVVFFTETAAQALGAYLESVPHAPQDVLLQSQGRPLSYGMAWQRIRRLGEAAGITDVSPSRLRHTYATVLLNNGMGLAGLRRLMGHEHLNTTLIYAQLADETLEQQYRDAMDSVTI